MQCHQTGANRGRSLVHGNANYVNNKKASSGYFAITVVYDDRHCESPISLYYPPSFLSLANGLLKNITFLQSQKFLPQIWQYR